MILITLDIFDLFQIAVPSSKYRKSSKYISFNINGSQYYEKFYRQSMNVGKKALKLDSINVPNHRWIIGWMDELTVTSQELITLDSIQINRIDARFCIGGE